MNALSVVKNLRKMSIKRRRSKDTSNMRLNVDIISFIKSVSMIG